jgi:uncharacterized protein (DUF488 family)
MTIYTIGHSMRELAEFVGILKAYNIGLLADVRSVPRSRFAPQFNEDNLERVLPESGIGYRHLEHLGGLRHTTKAFVNLGWHNTSFRGYADYMQTPEFAAGIDELLEIAEDKTVAIMCAEAVPWRCHRSLIGDALLVRGHEVIDIFDEHKTQAEKLTSFAVVHGTQITYPSDNG